MHPLLGILGISGFRWSGKAFPYFVPKILNLGNNLLICKIACLFNERQWIIFWTRYGHFLVLSIKLTHDDLGEGPKWSNSIFFVKFDKKYVSYTCLSWYKMIIGILNQFWFLVLLICILYPDGRPRHNGKSFSKDRIILFKFPFIFDNHFKMLNNNFNLSMDNKGYYNIEQF